jgi:hypothetical protein
MNVWTVFNRLRIGSSGGLLGTRNEPYDAIKDGEFLDRLRTVSSTRRILLHGGSN